MAEGSKGTHMCTRTHIHMHAHVHTHSEVESEEFGKLFMVVVPVKH